MMKKTTPLYASTALVCLALLTACATTQPRPTKSGIEVRKNVMIPMRDGAELAANITFPAGDGPYPVILTRTPYLKDAEEEDGGAEVAARGYVFVMQDCRGTGNSGGEWEPMMNEPRDGLDTHEWILDQPWCNGAIGTTGGSYLGWTQWAVAADTGDWHKAMFTVVPLIDCYWDMSYTGGAFGLGTNMTWGTEMLRPTEGEGAGVDTDNWNWDEAYRRLPLSTWDENIGYRVQFMRDWIAHPTFDEYWKQASVLDRLDEVDLPNITLSGWYDIFLSQALEHVTTVRNTSRSDLARRNQYVVVGPWAHGPNWMAGERDFGNDAEIDEGELSDKWFDHWLKGEDSGIDEWAPYRIFVMGRNEWRDEQEWPLARTQFTPYYLHSGGSANTLNGDGSLSIHEPGKESTDSFVYDPEDPVPTVGGNVLFGETYGSFDQREVEERDDVLVFTTDELEDEVEVTGPVKIVLYASSSAPDTDFTGKLLDVYPGGRAFNLCEGIIRARWRKASATPEFIQPGDVYRYEIDLWATSNVFLPGHRIRVEISSSNFPRFDRNLNTGNPFGTDAEIRKATQTIYHDADHLSHIVLPVIRD
jgi:putative CocE/NonD family hydrolase